MEAGNRVRLTWDDGVTNEGVVQSTTPLLIAVDSEPDDPYQYGVGVDGRYYEVNNAQDPLTIEVI